MLKLSWVFAPIVHAFVMKALCSKIVHYARQAYVVNRNQELGVGRS